MCTINRAEPRRAWDGEYPELFAPLTADELTSVYNYLAEQNLVYKRNPDEEVSLKSNYAPYMALFPPNKQQVLAFKAGTGPYPGR